MATPDPSAWLRRIFVLLAVMFVLQAFTVWQVHAIKKAVEAMEQIMPSMSIPVTVDPPGPATTLTVTVTTTQGEIDPDESQAEWIARTKDTVAAVKAGLEAS